MVFGFFRKKDDGIHTKINNINKNLHNSFTNIKKDMDEVGEWITHFKERHDKHDDKLEKINKRLEGVEEGLEKMREIWTRVQTGVQTRVQTRVQKTDVRLKQMSVQANTLEKLKNLTFMERGIVWVLLNSDIKIGYTDLFTALGKDKSTLRGQINNIKLKSPGLIKEEVENDGTKKFYIEEKAKSEILQSAKKVEVRSEKRRRKKK